MCAQLFARGGFNHLAGPIYTNAVGPILAWIKQQGQSQRGIAACSNRRRASHFAEARDLRTPHVIGIAGCMRQQMPERDRAFGRAKLGLASLVKAFEHTKRADFRHQGGGWRIQGKLARFHQHHRRRAGNGLGHGGNPKDAIGCHGVSTAQGAVAKARFPFAAMPVAQRQHHAWDFPSLTARCIRIAMFCCLSMP